MYQPSPCIIGNELYDDRMALFCDQYSAPYLGYAETYGNNYIHNNSIGLQYDSKNHLLMHAMGPNVAGVIGSAVAAGILLSFMS